MSNPFLLTSEYDGTQYVSERCSLNRAVLAKVPVKGIEDEIAGMTFSQIFSTPLIVAEIRRLSRHYALDLSDTPDSRLPQILNEGLVSDDARLRQLSERVVCRFGNRLGMLLLSLRMGEEENRLARPDWDDSCWDYWRQLDTVILTGGLASSMLGRRLKEQMMYIFDQKGVRPYNITLFENGAFLGVMGVAERLMGDRGCAMGFDLGHTNFKRALVRKENGMISGFTPFETIPSRFMQSRFDDESEKMRFAVDLHNYVVKSIVSAYKEATTLTEVSGDFLISIANYTHSGYLNPNRGGFAKLTLLDDHYASVLDEVLSGELKRPIRTILVHDATATALYFGDVPNAVSLTLGTGFGVGFPEIRL